MTQPDFFPPPQVPTILPAKRRFASLRVIGALILREMTTGYGRSPGGYIWAVLEPALGIGLLTAVFSLGFTSPGIGVNFPIFYATGMVPFLMFMDLSGKMASSLNFSRALLAYPTVSFVDAMIARFIVNALTQLLVAYLILGSILMIFETRTYLDFPVIATALGMAMALGVGVGSANCFLFTAFPLWQRAWSVCTRPMFMISCIFFVFDTIPQPYRDWLWYNPVIHIVGFMRHGFYPSYHAPYVSLLYVFLVSLSLTLTGLVFLRRYHRDLLNA